MEEVIGVSRKGVVTAVSLGAAVITVSDAKNADHFDQAVVSSSPAINVQFSLSVSKKFAKVLCNCALNFQSNSLE